MRPVWNRDYASGDCELRPLLSGPFSFSSEFFIMRSKALKPVTSFVMASGETTVMLDEAVGFFTLYSRISEP